jgi:hypothetical protein
MMELSLGLSLLKNLPTEAETVLEDVALARHLSDIALLFTGNPPGLESPRAPQPDFWLFLPFATAPDFPLCPPEQVRKLALASTCMIIYNILFDAAVDDPAKPDITTQVLAEYALASMHEHLYALFATDSPFWNYYKPMYERFLGSMVEECSAHKGRPQPYRYDDYVRISQHKMSMVLMIPVGLAILGKVPERIPELLAAWDEMDTGVVMFDDIKDWEEDFEQRNYTYLLTEALHIDGKSHALPKNHEDLITQVTFSGAMEELYRQGAQHMDRAAELAEKANSPALATLAQERAEMFRRFVKQLVRRKLDGLREKLITPASSTSKNKEEVP